MTPEQEHDERQSVITAVFVVLALFAIVCALASSAGADDSAYLRARAAIAINASLTKTGGTDAAPSLETAKPKAEAKPVVNLYSATWCGACKQAKAELESAAKELPFTVRIVDVDKEGWPAYATTIPWVSWPKSPGWVWQQSYPGVKELVSQWRNTQLDRSRTSASSAGRAGMLIKMGNLATRHWSYPGQIHSHLMQAHGITQAEAAMLTREQAEQIHDAIHEGTSVTRIRTWARSRGIIK